MEPTTNLTPPYPPHYKNKRVAVLIAFLFVVICGLTATTGYYYLKLQQNTSTKSSQDLTSEKNVDTQTGYHFVTSEGYPFNTNRKFTVKLAVPNELQAIKWNSSIQDPGLTANILGDKFNGEMGRWLLDRPTNSDSYLGDFSFINIEDQWLKTNTTGNEDYHGMFPYNLPLPTSNMSSAQKQAFIAQLKTETDACVADGKTGFSIAKTIKVCIKPYQSKQAVGSYNPMANLHGYGIIDGLHFVLAGSLELRDDKTYTPEQETALQNEFKSDKLPADTEKILTRYISALKNTTVTSETR